MRTSLFATIATLAIAAGVAGCQSPAPRGRTVDSVPHLDAHSAEASGLSAQDVVEAGALYETKCAKCHKFYDPAQYSPGEWDTWMKKMSRKSRLKPGQEELLSRYLGAYRAGHP
jgi:cytochrome c5